MEKIKKNIRSWIIFFMVALVLIIPFALVAGHYRGIPYWWQLVDCSFGVIGIISLFICLKLINKLEEINTKNYVYETTD